MPNDSRNPVIDVAKGLGIVVVFIGHLSYWGTPLSKFAYSFHLPLFFFCSGIVFRPEKFACAREVLVRVAVSFVFPYFFFVALGLLPFICGLMRQNLSVLYVLKSIFFTGHPEPDRPLWFLVTLAEIQLLSWLMSRRIDWSGNIAIGCTFLLGVAVAMTLQIFPSYRTYIPYEP